MTVSWALVQSAPLDGRMSRLASQARTPTHNGRRLWKQGCVWLGSTVFAQDLSFVTLCSVQLRMRSACIVVCGMIRCVSLRWVQAGAFAGPAHCVIMFVKKRHGQTEGQSHGHSCHSGMVSRWGLTPTLVRWRGWWRRLGVITAQAWQQHCQRTL